MPFLRIEEVFWPNLGSEEESDAKTHDTEASEMALLRACDRHTPFIRHLPSNLNRWGIGHFQRASLDHVSADRRVRHLDVRRKQQVTVALGVADGGEVCLQ